MRRFLANTLLLSQLNLKLALRDPLPILLGSAMPLFFIYFLRPVYSASDRLTDVEGMASGFLAMFAFFLVPNVAQGFFSEHEWGTWDRLRLSGSSVWSIFLGKSVTPLFAFFVQFGLVLGGARVIFGSSRQWNLGSLVGVCLLFAIYLVLFGSILAVWCTSLAQVSAISSLLSPILAALGGALVPVHILPLWVQCVAPFTPVYWVMGGMSCSMGVSCGASFWGAVLLSASIHVALTAVIFVISLRVVSRRSLIVRA